MFQNNLNFTPDLDATSLHSVGDNPSISGDFLIMGKETSRNLLTLIKECGKDKYGTKLGEFLCECGNTKVLRLNTVKNNITKSCGCLLRKQIVERTTVECLCGTKFETTVNRIADGRGRFCSQKCKYKYRVMPKGITHVFKEPSPTWFKKGEKTWNFGTAGKGICKPNKGSIKKGQRRGIGTEFKKGVVPQNFKGESVGYHALHRWVSNHKIDPKQCEHCGNVNCRLEWANKSHEYKRDLEDWLRLCKKCHASYDKGFWGVASKKYPSIKRKQKNNNK